MNNLDAALEDAQARYPELLRAVARRDAEVRTCSGARHMFSHRGKELHAFGVWEATCEVCRQKFAVTIGYGSGMWDYPIPLIAWQKGLRKKCSPLDIFAQWHVTENKRQSVKALRGSRA